MVPATIVENFDFWPHGFCHEYPHGLCNAMSFPILVGDSGYHEFCHGTFNVFPSSLITAVKLHFNVEVKSSIQLIIEFTIWNLIWTPENFQMDVSRKRKKLPEIRWCQNSRIVEGFHPLFHESDLAPLFHPLSALSLKETAFSRCSRCHNLSQNGSEYAPGTFLHEGKKKLQSTQKWGVACKICELFHFGSFSHFHSARLKTQVSRLLKVLETKENHHKLTPR